MYADLRAKYPLFLPDFNETHCLSTDFRKIFQVWISLKIRPVGAELFHADGRTDRQANMTKAMCVSVWVCVCVCVCVCVW